MGKTKQNTDNSTDTYLARGVSSQKEGVHNAIKNLGKGIFSNSFAKVLPDIFANDPDYGVISHADGTGTKVIGNYLAHKDKFADASVFRWSSQDAMVMNLDDIFATGLPGSIAYVQGINRNKNKISDEILSELVNGTVDFINVMESHGIEIVYAGGETADLGDSVRTITVDGTMTCRMKKENAINIKILPGDLIVGLSSSGKANYENTYNSGIGSNGLTDARHDLLGGYLVYTEAYDPDTKKELVYRGGCKLDDKYTIDGKQYELWELLLSPTRTYAPILKKVHEKIQKNLISGIIHCSGGGQTKVLKFTDPKIVTIVKDNLFEEPYIFKLIKVESGNSAHRMFSTFNMGHRMEVCVHDVQTAKEVIDISHSFGVEGKIIGKCVAPDEDRMRIITPYGELLTY